MWECPELTDKELQGLGFDPKDKELCKLKDSLEGKISRCKSENFHCTISAGLQKIIVGTLLGVEKDKAEQILALLLDINLAYPQQTQVVFKEEKNRKLFKKVLQDPKTFMNQESTPMIDWLCTVFKATDIGNLFRKDPETKVTPGIGSTLRNINI